MKPVSSNYSDNKDTINESSGRHAGRIILRILSFLLVVVVLLAVSLLTVIWVVSNGPSPTAQRMFVLTVKETSAAGFLADIFLSEEEVDLILNPPAHDTDDPYQTDTTLISIPSQRAQFTGYETGTDPNNEDDIYTQAEDIPDIELHEVNGIGYRGYMLIVHDPKRVYVGTLNTFGEGRGWTVIEHVNRHDALAGINGGGFYDPEGRGTGGIPEGIVISDGAFKWGANSGTVCVMGFDEEGILHVGDMTATTARNLGLQEALSFGPALIINGVPQNVRASGVNPRTAIGQRADGAVLLLVVDGRQIDSVGATFRNLVDIFLEFDAVNAGNLDGGSSTLMVYDGDVINSGPTMIHNRRMPTTFLVRKADEG
jgi:exopolysaccharide biosynthesis protein